MKDDPLQIPENGEIVGARDNRDQGGVVALRNDLVRAVHRIDLRGKRLLGLAISRLDSRQKYTPAQTDMTITALQWAEMYPAGRENPYRELKEAMDNIFEAEIRFNLKPTKNGKPRYRRVRWVELAEYDEGLAQVRLRFSKAVLPYLTQLKREFTTYKLEQVRALRSAYAWRLYEMLMQFRDTGMVEIPLDELHECLETPPSARKNFGQMRYRVIAPAVKELEAKAELEIVWNPKRRGKRVASVVFGFQPRRQLQMFEAKG